MKKLLLMLLAVAGMVCTASAENITKRIFVKTDANFQQYQGDGLAVHAWYTDGTGDVYTQDTDNEKMATFTDFNPSDAKGLWFKDIVFDASKTIRFFVYKKGNTSWHSSDASQKELNSSSGINSYTWTSSDNGELALDETPVSYYAYLYDGTNWTQQSLSTEDYMTYYTTIDNQTSFNSSLELLIAPSLAFDSDFSSYKWCMMYRPYSENQTVGFSNQIALNGGCYGSSNQNILKLNAAAKYVLHYYPLGWTYSLEPYIERTISDGYATFSSDYDVAIPEGVTAYYATAAEAGTVTMTSISNGIPSAQGAFLKASDGTYKFTSATTTETSTTNLLVKGTSDGVAASVSGTTYNYVFASQGNELGFFEVNSAITQSMTGKAYLQTTSSIKPAGARVAIVFDEESTGIETVKGEGAALNGCYNLSGQRVAQPAKGLFIVNGKKVLVK